MLCHVGLWNSFTILDHIESNMLYIGPLVVCFFFFGHGVVYALFPTQICPPYVYMYVDDYHLTLIMIEEIKSAPQNHANY